MSGRNNTADWVPRGRTPDELNKGSNWWKGPPSLYQPIEDWGLKFGLQKEEPLPGEKFCSTTAVTVQPTFIRYERFSDIDRVI